MDTGITCALPFTANSASPALAGANPSPFTLVPSGNIPMA